MSRHADQPLKIGLVDDPILQKASAVVAQAIETAASRLRDAGIDVQRRSVPARLDEIIACTGPSPNTSWRAPMRTLGDDRA